MPRILMALALLCALASPAMAARRHPVCVAVMIEMVPARIYPQTPTPLTLGLSLSKQAG